MVWLLRTSQPRGRGGVICFCTSSRQLNAESDSLNEIINAVSDKLAALNLGVEVWRKPEEEDLKDVQIGFARVPETKRWALAVRWQVWRTEQLAQSTVKDVKRWEIVPLIKESRDIRLAALKMLPAIIGLLKSEAKGRLDSILAAKQLASQL